MENQTTIDPAAQAAATAAAANAQSQAAATAAAAVQASQIAARTAELDRLQTANAELVRGKAEAMQRETEARTQLLNEQRTAETLRTTLKELEPRAKLAGDLEVEVEGYKQRARESELIDELQAKIPGAARLVIKGTLTALHEANEVDRFAKDPKAEAVKAFAAIEAKAPQLLRPPTTGGGTSGANNHKQAPAPKRGLL